MEHREIQIKCSSGSRFTVCRYTAPMRFNNRLRKRQAKPDSLCILRIPASIKSFKNIIQILGMNPSPIIFYGNLKSADGSVRHTGDNLTGEGDGDDEVLIIDFTKVPADVEKIAITVTIYEAPERRQNFGQVSNAYVRVARMAGPEDMVGTEVLKFDLMEEFSIETALVVCEIYRNGADWKFNAVGAGYQGGLEALCKSYGVNV